MYKKLTEKDFSKTNGTHYLTTIDTKYRDLLGKLGAPAFEPEDFGDGKVMYKWVFYNDDDVFTVYDWKTYDEEYTRSEYTDWHVGGAGKPDKFVNWIHERLYNLNN